MEQVYDSYSNETKNGYKTYSKRNMLPQPMIRKARLDSSISNNAVANEFAKLPNPELTMYVYPHFAAKDQVPIPGYSTKFNAYEEDHYVLMNEIERE